MGKGISLHIGLNYIDPNHYNGWDGKLNACENDAIDMELIASSQNFETQTLIREEATRENVIAAIKLASTKLNNGDIFYISYSGHGGKMIDLNNDEPDGVDETWCLFNGQLIDDELKQLWTLFKLGVRIFVTSDSCHSGSVIKAANNESVSYTNATPKYMNNEIALNVYLKNKSFYTKIIQNTPKTNPDDVKATVILISGCQDNQYSYDGIFNGTFTARLKQAWNGGKFRGNYRNFQLSIQNLLPAYQSPNYLTVGKPNSSFENEKPFTI